MPNIWQGASAVPDHAHRVRSALEEPQHPHLTGVIIIHVVREPHTRGPGVVSQGILIYVHAVVFVVVALDQQCVSVNIVNRRANH